MVICINTVYSVFILAPLLYAESIVQGSVSTVIPLTITERITRDFIHAMPSRGLLLHLQTVVFKSHEDIGLSSFIINANGTELLATSRTGSFISIDLIPTEAPKFDVTSAKAFSMNLQPNESDAEGLTINGVYEGGGKGEFYVIFGESQKVMKFMDVISNQEDRPSLDALNQCPSGKAKSLLKLNSTNDNGLLLSACNKPTLPRGTEDFDGLYPIYAYNETSGEVGTFLIKSRRKFEPIDMAHLPNGDLIVLFRRLPGRNKTKNDMRLEYIAADSLYQALGTVSIVTPERMATWRDKAKLPIGRPQSLAVRQDPITSKIFIYILATNNMNNIHGDDKENNDHTTSISMYEWDPTPIKPKLPDEPCFSHAGDFYTTTGLWIAMAMALMIGL